MLADMRDDRARLAYGGGSVAPSSSLEEFGMGMPLAPVSPDGRGGKQGGGGSAVSFNFAAPKDLPPR